MPSASIKPVQHGSQENLDPIQKIISLFEKKSRNLMKRMNKIKALKTEQDNGKTLCADQLESLKAYDTVNAYLEITKEFQDQFNQVLSENNKLLKKQMRKEQQEKAQEDLEKMKEIIRIQAVLQRMGSPTIRADFLEGKNGAITLTQENLDEIDNIFKLVTPSFENMQDSSSFDKLIDTAADHLTSLVEAKQKTVVTLTYKELHTLLSQIASCPYPETTEEVQPEPTSVEEEKDAPVTTEPTVEETVEAPVISNQTTTPVEAVVENTEILPQEQTNQSLGNTISSNVTENGLDRVTASDCPPPGLAPPSVSPVPPETTPEILAANLAQLNVTNQPPPAPNVPTPGQSFFNPAANIPMPVDVHDLVSKGDFDFLQESQVPEVHNPNLYIDPAVVSLGKVKPPEPMVQLHEQQPPQEMYQHQIHQAQPQQTNSLSTTDNTQMSNLQTQNNYPNQSYGSYNQNMSYTNNVNEMNSNNTETQEKVTYTNESNNWVDHDEPSIPVEENWGNNEMENKPAEWGEDPEEGMNSVWSSDYDKPYHNNNQNDYERRNYKPRGGNRGNMNGNNRYHRGNRNGGGGGGYGGYQNGPSGGRGGGNYGNNFRNGGRMNSMGNGGYNRGSRGGPRGNGNGNMRSNGGYRGANKSKW